MSNSSGEDVRDVRWTFICQHCDADNDKADAYAEGYDVWAVCESCGVHNDGRLDDE